MSDTKKIDQASQDFAADLAALRDDISKLTGSVLGPAPFAGQATPPTRPTAGSARSAIGPQAAPPSARGRFRRSGVRFARPIS